MSRDVLAPPLQRMGDNRCYRVNLVHEDFGGHPSNRQNQQPLNSNQGYTEQDLYAEDDDDEDEGTSYTIAELPNSIFKLTMHVAQPFYGGIIGFKGSTKRRIEGETRTDIFIPRSKEGGKNESEDIIIKGKTRNSVCTARRKINLLIISLRRRMRPTHFIGVPVNFGEVKENFSNFKKEILDAKLPDIDEDLFQNELRIHLTLITCVLLDDAERGQAVQLLQSCRNLLTDIKIPFEVEISGLEIMNDDPSAVRVLYADVKAPDLQTFGDRVMNTFIRSGLSFNEFGRENVKLHMTVMSASARRKSNPNAANSFDAREILKRYGDYKFGAVKCNDVHLCVISRDNELRKDYYHITGSLKL